MSSNQQRTAFQKKKNGPSSSSLRARSSCPSDIRLVPLHIVTAPRPKIIQNEVELPDFLVVAWDELLRKVIDLGYRK